MKNSSMPMLKRNIVRRNGSACSTTAGLALTRRQQPRREEVAARREHADRQQHRDEERLIDDAIDALVIVGAGRARDEHAHAR